MQTVPERQGAEHSVVLAAAVGAGVPDGGDARRLRDRRPRAAHHTSRTPHQGRALLRETSMNTVTSSS